MVDLTQMKSMHAASSACATLNDFGSQGVGDGNGTPFFCSYSEATRAMRRAKSLPASSPAVSASIDAKNASAHDVRARIIPSSRARACVCVRVARAPPRKQLLSVAFESNGYEPLVK